MYCIHCGKELDENMKFCPNCGKKQEKECAYYPTRELFSKIGKKLKSARKTILGISITVVIGVFLILLFIPKNKPSQGLEYEFWGENYSVVGIGTCEDTKIVIPNEYNGYPVASISDKAFWGCEKITSVHMPDTIEFISDHAFIGCINLIDVHFSENLEAIGDYAFTDCLKLEKIKLPNSIQRIGTYAFSDCVQIKQVKIPVGCKKISDFAFSGCAKLERIDIPNSITYMGAGCFSGNENVEVYYDGSSFEWITISNASPYKSSPYFVYHFEDKYKVFCTDGVID